MESVKVAVNGYGVIGKRVADAVRAQPDMELVGVADVVADYRTKTAVALGIPLYASTRDGRLLMEAAGITVAGMLHQLLNSADVVVDCTPAKAGAANLEHYLEHGLKAVFQGGEKHETIGHSFVAAANYDSARGRDATRVVSCNTTATVRTLTALKRADLLGRARGVLIRRATDPWESDHSGIMNTLVPEATIPSHQGPDARSVDPDLDVVTIAAKGSHTQNHMHFWTIEAPRHAGAEEVLDALRAMPRVALLRRADGIVALNSTVELMRDLGRPRGDMYEVGLWEDILTIAGNEIYYTYTVDNQAIVIPETIDAIRALTETATAEESVRRTDAALGIKADFLKAADEAVKAHSEP